MDGFIAHGLNRFQDGCVISFCLSLHGELASDTRHDFVGDNDFLGASPEVLVAPGMSPLHEVEHREHREEESSRKRLPSDHWESQIGCC